MARCCGSADEDPRTLDGFRRLYHDLERFGSSFFPAGRVNRRPLHGVASALPECTQRGAAGKGAESVNWCSRSCQPLLSPLSTGHLQTLRLGGSQAVGRPIPIIEDRFASEQPLETRRSHSATLELAFNTANSSLPRDRAGDARRISGRLLIQPGLEHQGGPDVVLPLAAVGEVFLPLCSNGVHLEK
ncbi:MAG: hypothetical protein QOK37_1764 [Thermoanaerobaculia bacterium]|nr:hypothetical protein [Thermoanaerobaculia bacterium]